jgi:large subunit ribosomal protein L4
MKLTVLNKDGKETSRQVDLNPAVFGIEPNDHAIYLDVKLYLANQRQGTHKSKERGEVAGSTRKLKRQKGTGGARAGSKKSPLMKGGGRVFGPQPRDYGFKVNSKMKALARRSALSYKAKENNITVLPENNKNVYLSSRNLTRAKVVTASELNTYDVLNAGKLILTEGSISVIEKILA